ncbi:thioredoxin family protein [Maribacter sp. CXY002]|uniref:thioredoxin family protein n=1 Tax=Maribacter luteocoastalis TaxID=3407671 RepID=UPI003B678FC4
MNKGIIHITLVVLMGLNTLFAQDWQQDISKAKEIATNENKPIILVFQGSDWCAPCIKLDREVWSTDFFKNYANEHFVMLQADFPRRKSNALPEAQAKANAQLAGMYNKNGIFPFVVVLDKNGKVLGETSYKKMSAQAYVEELNRFIK